MWYIDIEDDFTQWEEWDFTWSIASRAYSYNDRVSIASDDVSHTLGVF